MSAPAWLTARPVAHRGLHDAAAGIVENTLPAVEAAIDGGFAIEVDLQPALGDVPVVFHDETLDRLTVGTGPLAARDAGSLAKIAFRDTAARIPTLDDLLDCVAGRVPLVIEVKTVWQPAGAFERVIADRLRAYDGPAAVMSFDPRSVEAFRHHAPWLTRGIVSESFAVAADWPELDAATRRKLGWMLHLPRSRPQFVAYGIRDLPSFLPLALRHLFGMPLLTWTVRTPEQRARAARYADQMIFEGFRPGEVAEEGAADRR
ncbi:MAG: glycerophosphodiester phosphodiesterase family protein [Flavobacteriaceae bacterium]